MDRGIRHASDPPPESLPCAGFFHFAASGQPSRESLIIHGFSAFGKCWAWGSVASDRITGAHARQQAKVSPRRSGAASGQRPGKARTEGTTMKQGIHPNYREVCFVDLSNGFKFVTRSCAQTKESIKMEDGRDLPLFKLETTSETHPFYTGTQKSVDSLGGRVEKFRNKFARVGMKK
jgi:large subunit ribosomal protein L31